MLFKKVRKNRKAEMSIAIEQILPDGCTLLLFEYDKKHFGNMIAEIQSPSKVYTFVTDRGEVYCNKKMICDSSYRYLEKEDTFSKLLSIIKNELNDITT